MSPFPAILVLALVSFILPSVASPDPPSAPAPRSPALAEIDRRIREDFWDPNLKGVDWNGAVERAAADLAAAAGDPERDAAYDRLLARLDDSHTFRIPAGRLPEARWATAGLRIGLDGAGYAVKAVLPGGAAERAGLRLGDRIVSIGGREYGASRLDFRALFLALEGPLRSTVEVAWETAGGERKTATLALEPEPPGDTLFWRSARVVRRGGHAFGYARLWGISPEVALALVDLLSDRTESAAAKPELAGLADIEGFLLDVRGNSGGYDPGILSTFLRGRWSAGDYRVRSRGRVRVVPPEYHPLPIALLVNSGTASSGEALALKFRRHGIGPIVGEETAGMLSGGAAVVKLPDGSSLWFSARAIEDADGQSYEGRGVRPDVVVADRPAKTAGQEDAVVEAAIRVLSARARK
ncbi:MAG: S41 family peptidase [Acidobacteriota bacterium]|nr:S41 family peptidase [Acidobacteriota bacterium]